MGLLEGKEVDKEFDGGAGKYYVDVEANGKIEVGMSYEKDLDGYAKVSSANKIETNIFDVARKIAAKNNVSWDETLINTLESILGIASGSGTLLNK